MPKECGHWIIARRVAATYAGPRVGALLSRWEPLYLLGAVLPDTAFYTLAGPHKARLREIADTLHGERGGDPLFFLSRAVGEPAAALALGAACHIMTDSQFHPIVYYFCGIDETHAGALRRHFAFEGWLDAHYCSLEAPPRQGRLARILAATGLPLVEIAALTRSLLGDGSTSTRSFARALRRHARLQGLFWSPALQWATGATRRLAPRSGAALIAAPFYPRRRGPVPFFGGPFTHAHPVTGKSRTETLADVEARVAALMHKVFDAFERDASPAELASLPRLSAETGLAPSAAPRAGAMRHFGVADTAALLGVAARGRPTRRRGQPRGPAAAPTRR